MRRLVPIVLVVLVLAGTAILLLRDDGPEDVVLIVLDNVRADHLSLCGYERPTSPNLDAFAENGWESCEGVAPGSWTGPTHASYFTGLEVPEHGVHFATAGVGLGRVHGLGEEPTTLAEEMAAQGYQTALVSSNPALDPITGLTRGFEIVRVAPDFPLWFGPNLVRQVNDVLYLQDHDRPRFLFVNIADAHLPWTDVPPGLHWLPAQPRPDLTRIPGSPLQQLVEGTLPAEEADILTDRMVDVYDYAVYRADLVLGDLLALLEHVGLDDARILITSDHGEFLGEHRMVGHCCSGYEENTRVPLVSSEPLSVPPGPFNALNLHSVVLSREWPPEPVPPRNVAEPNPRWSAVSDWFGHQTWVTAWEGTTKHHWIDGETYTIDLEDDPFERNLVDAEPNPQVEALAEDLLESLEREASDMSLDAQLKALGYLD